MAERGESMAAMPTQSHVLAFLGAATIFVLIPGPSVLFTIGRAISAGRRTAILSVIGNGFGTLVLALLIGVGLGPIVAASAVGFTILKLAGAGYLVWLGIQAFRERGHLADLLAQGAAAEPSTRHALRSGFLVGVTNPKSLVFLAAFLPQFVDRSAGPVWIQLVVMALVIVVLGWLSDSAFALAGSQIRTWFAGSPKRLARVGGTGGLMMMGLGIGLLFTGRPTD